MSTTSGAVLSPAGAIVRCAGVVHVYQVATIDVAALRGVDLEVPAGERIALLGPSGSGKSTLLSLLAGLRSPTAGQVLIDDHDISRAGGRELHRHRRRSGLMLQGASANLLPYASPAENVRYARRGSKSGPDVLALAGLQHERRPISDLGRADRQAVALAVAMVDAPRLLLVDEPTSQLDDAARDRLLDALIEVTGAAGTTVVMVTHDEEVAGRMQRMVRMRDGRVGSEGVRSRPLAVIGADGSVQLPEGLLQHWPPGSRVEVTAAGPDLLHLTRAEQQSERRAEQRSEPS